MDEALNKNINSNNLTGNNSTGAESRQTSSSPLNNSQGILNNRAIKRIKQTIGEDATNELLEKLEKIHMVNTEDENEDNDEDSQEELVNSKIREIVGEEIFKFIDIILKGDKVNLKDCINTLNTLIDKKEEIKGTFSSKRRKQIQ